MKNLILVIIVFISFNSVAQVTSVTGTANQVIASGSTGAITLSTPQDIAIASSPRFNKLALGTSTHPAIVFTNATNITGGTTAYNILINSVVQNDVTTIAFGSRISLGTAASSFTAGNLTYNYVSQGVIGAGSTVINQHGYRVAPNFTGATNNYGFFGEIAAATGRWNLYMPGTALNYLSGALLIGSNTDDGANKLQVTGNAIFNGNRPITISPNVGSINIKGSTGGWATAYRFSGSANTSLGGFGAFGTADVLTRYYIGTYSTDEKLSVLGNGNVGIGTTNPTEKLSVNGNIRAKEIRVEASPWPDYVFHKSYSLQPLSEVEKFIATNQHLPGIPSASEVEKDGLNLGEMNAKLLKKIEELTLYLIEQQKQTEQIKQKQDARIVALEKALLAGTRE